MKLRQPQWTRLHSMQMTVRRLWQSLDHQGPHRSPLGLPRIFQVSHHTRNAVQHSQSALLAIPTRPPEMPVRQDPVESVHQARPLQHRVAGHTHHKEKETTLMLAPNVQHKRGTWIHWKRVMSTAAAMGATPQHLLFTNCHDQEALTLKKKRVKDQASSERSLSNISPMRKMRRRR
jgi:hypothetical protein